MEKERMPNVKNIIFTTVAVLCVLLSISYDHDLLRRKLLTKKDRKLVRKGLATHQGAHTAEGFPANHDRLLEEDIPERIVAVSVDKTTGPALAHLWGFPWAGQSFVQKAMHDLTGFSTAVNYGRASMFPSGIVTNSAYSSVPVYTNQRNGERGPFAFSTSHPLPDHGLVLTRTYCAGHCVACWPKEYIVPSVHRWLFECGIGENYEKEIDKGQPAFYNTTNDVKAIIHMVRNPLDHIPQRFEHEYERWEQGNATDMLEKYPLNRHGFHEWCASFDDDAFDGRLRKVEESYYLKDNKVLKLSKLVPCHADFYRLVQWHNYAFEARATVMADVPAITFYYEDIVQDAQSAAEQISEFIGLDYNPNIQVTPAESTLWHELPRYKASYVEERDYHHVANYIRRIATPETWNALERYFN